MEQANARRNKETTLLDRVIVAVACWCCSSGWFFGFYCCLDKGELEGESNLMFACGQLHCSVNSRMAEVR